MWVNEKECEQTNVINSKTKMPNEIIKLGQWYIQVNKNDKKLGVVSPCGLCSNAIKSCQTTQKWQS